MANNYILWVKYELNARGLQHYIRKMTQLQHHCGILMVTVLAAVNYALYIYFKYLIAALLSTRGVAMSGAGGVWPTPKITFSKEIKTNYNFNYYVLFLSQSLHKIGQNITGYIGLSDMGTIEYQYQLYHHHLNYQDFI